mgnify:FL=1
MNIKDLIKEEIQNRIKSRSASFEMLMDNDLPSVGKVIIQNMNEDTAVILALKNILKKQENEQRT